jgi:hypothetical protein
MILDSKNGRISESVFPRLRAEESPLRRKWKTNRFGRPGSGFGGLLGEPQDWPGEQSEEQWSIEQAADHSASYF